jgi:hypothetical protein
VERIALNSSARQTWGSQSFARVYTGEAARKVTHSQVGEKIEEESAISFIPQAKNIFGTRMKASPTYTGVKIITNSTKGRVFPRLQSLSTVFRELSTGKPNFINLYLVCIPPYVGIFYDTGGNLFHILASKEIGFTQK